jgi:hypothetical protein
MWWTLGYLQVIFIVVVSLLPPVHIPKIDFDWIDKFFHFAAYLVLMLWFVQINPPHRYGFIARLFIKMGVGLEIVQGLMAYRTLDFWDMLANILGVLAGWGLGAGGLNRILVGVERVFGR